MNRKFLHMRINLVEIHKKLQSQYSRNCNTVHFLKNLLCRHVSSGSEISLSKNITKVCSLERKFIRNIYCFW